jgi:hypothetical protein
MIIMSTLSRTKYLTAALAAATCLMFASGVRAAEPADDQAFADSPTAVCHPAYRPCRKEAPRPVAARSASADTGYIAVGQFDHVPFSSVCHPAYQPCANWKLRVEKSTK